MKKLHTYHLHLSGQVQGVGFRPFVWRLARAWGLKGWVNNTTDGVHVVFNAPAGEAEAFAQAVLREAPALSVITGHTLEIFPAQTFPDFQILHSAGDAEPDLLLTPDFGLCDDCRRELNDPANRRARYAFLTCTHCGPRYSIITALPYDRERTTIAPFRQCPACAAEYNDPADRRYYSQTNSCPVCGITLRLIDTEGQTRPHPLETAIVWLKAGKILAVKGIGGYLLLCDATDAGALTALRARKRRPSKPFALLYGHLEQLAGDALVDAAEEKLLQSPAAPIVLLPLREHPASGICAGLVAPGLDQIGVMLPYTPLLELIARGFGKPLVATSGNISGSPILYEDDKAQQALSGIADALLMNNRDIAIPQDDSVVRLSPVHGQKIVLRRSRGYAPTFLFETPPPTPMAINLRMERPPGVSTPPPSPIAINLRSKGSPGVSTPPPSPPPKGRGAWSRFTFGIPNRDGWVEWGRAPLPFGGGVGGGVDTPGEPFSLELMVMPPTPPLKERVDVEGTATPGLPSPSGEGVGSILALGATLKSTFTWRLKGNTYISQYLGDLDSFDTQEAFEHTLRHFLDLFRQKPDQIAVDKHPDYFSTRLGKRLAGEWQIPVREVQHHKAHFAAVLAENGYLTHKEGSPNPILGVIWDGTGYGDDGQVWGGEFFIYHRQTIERVAHFEPFAFILGDKMPREPRISALSLAHDQAEAKPWLEPKFSAQEWAFYQKMLARPASLYTTSVGRLFDGVTSLLGLADRVSYEGEAAMLLEQMAARYFKRNGLTHTFDIFTHALPDTLLCPTKSIVQQVVAAAQDGAPPEMTAALFHAMLIEQIRRQARRHGCRTLAFSGGVWQNALLVDLALEWLRPEFELLFHHQLSPNDEGVSFGQAVLMMNDE